MLGEAKVIGRAGSLFGAGNDYVRISLTDSQDHFNILLNHIEKLVSQEKIQSGTRLHFDNTANRTWHAYYQFMGLDRDIQGSFDGSRVALHEGAATVDATRVQFPGVQCSFGEIK